MCSPLKSPLENPNYFAMLCFSNGSLAREVIRDILCDGRWDEMEGHLASTAPGANGCIALWWAQVRLLIPITTYDGVSHHVFIAA